MGINQFAPYTQQEFEKLVLMPKKYFQAQVIIQQSSSNGDVDWTQKGMVSPVKNQGHCGSCWAFSAIATLQSYALMKGQSKTFSQQQLVDCSHLYGNFGCDGGQNFKGLSYIKDHGIVTDAQYPYIAKNQFCKIHGGPYKISQVASAKGCTGIQTAVQGRPIGIAVDAANWAHYSSGVFNDCKSNYLDHNVLLVGVTGTYWKVKNSWGTSWGQKGYIRLSKGNTCGICNDRSPWPV